MRRRRGSRLPGRGSTRGGGCHVTHHGPWVSSGEQDAVDDVDRGVGGLHVAADDLGLADGEVLARALDRDGRARERLVVAGEHRPGASRPSTTWLVSTVVSRPFGSAIALSRVALSSAAKASLVGAKTVMSLAVLSVSPRPASVTAVTRVDSTRVVARGGGDRVGGHAGERAGTVGGDRGAAGAERRRRPCRRSSTPRGWRGAADERHGGARRGSGVGVRRAAGGEGRGGGRGPGRRSSGGWMRMGAAPSRVWDLLSYTRGSARHPTTDWSVPELVSRIAVARGTARPHRCRRATPARRWSLQVARVGSAATRR